MFSTDDTIVAIATPLGRSGIGVIRLSGPSACTVAGALLTTARPLAPRYATFTCVKSASAVRTPGSNHQEGGAPGSRLDQVVATFFQRPASYTGEDVVEISAHGSVAVLHGIVAAAVQAGARLASPGEFTLRAFLNGRLDLVQAEAIGDLVDAVTPTQARAAFDQLEGTLTRQIGEIDRALFDIVARFEASIDFPDEGYHFVEPGAVAADIASIQSQLMHLLGDASRGRLIREGAQVVIAGKPNVGKSSLFNALVGTGRAIVTATAGTTRDFITEATEIEGMCVTLVDTAGDRTSCDQTNIADEIETEGIARARAARSVADLVLVVLDGSRPLDEVDDQLLAETASARHVIVVNKIDLPAIWGATSPGEGTRVTVPVSVRTGEGIEALRRAIVQALGAGELDRETAAVTNIRHIELLRRAQAALCRTAQAVDESAGRLSEEFVLADLQEARNALEEITGRRTPEDLLEHIFQRFCIGK